MPENVPWNMCKNSDQSVRISDSQVCIFFFMRITKILIRLRAELRADLSVRWTNMSEDTLRLG